MSLLWPKSEEMAAIEATPSNTPHVLSYPGVETLNHAYEQDEPTPSPVPIQDVPNSNELQDFLHLVSHDDTFADDELLQKLRRMTKRHDNEVDEEAPEAVIEDNEMLLAFQSYWKEEIDKYGAQPVVEITLQDAKAVVKALRPRKEHRLDNMWTPITRACGRLCGRSSRIEVPVFEHSNAQFCPGEMTLLVGDPGSGKSTLLKMIAGRLIKDHHWKTSGIFINRHPIDAKGFHPARYIALVDEVDLHIPTMTVEDTLKFAYKCNSAHGDVKHVETILKILGLSHVAKTKVGDENIRGCSGGERRRVTVGEQWAANVRVLLADRLTDGLDSQATLDLIKALRVWSYATEATVVLSLLQPPREVYKYFDKVCILQRGRPNPIVYCGPIQQAAAKMSELGYEQEAAGAMAGNGLGESHMPSEQQPEKQGSPYKRGYFQQLFLLLQRQYRLEFFNRGLLISRILLNLINGLATASIFKTSDNVQSALFIRSSLLFHTCMSIVISIASHIGLLGADRPVFYKQRAGYFFHSSAFWIAHNFYYIFVWGLIESFLLCVTTYWLSGLQKNGAKFMIFWMACYMLNLISSIIFKILAIICSTVSVGQTWAGFIQIIFFAFSGFLQPWPVMPTGWTWARWISPQSYTFGILMINEFQGTTYNCTQDELVTYEGVCPYTSGNDWLDVNYGMETDNSMIGWLFFAMVGWYFFYFILGAVALRYVIWNREVMHRTPDTAPAQSKSYLVMPPQVTLSWKDMTYTVKPKKEEPKVLLQGVSGIIKPQTLSALMGPSGAGKTTLLDVLAGRKTGGEITGDILVNGHPKEQKSFNRISGYVEQFNCQIELLTVYEALEFSARLRLQSGVSDQERTDFIDTVVDMLELKEVAKEQIADILLDQKKRTSVGVEVVSGPSILFLDEPTTGLDSLGAHVLVRALTRLRDEMKVAIVCTIHQPSKDIFWMFDRLVLMAKGGKMVYAGDLGAESSTFVQYMESISLVAPIKRGENPAAWMLQQIGGGVCPNPERTEAVVSNWSVSAPGQALLQELDTLTPGESMDTGKAYNLGCGAQLEILLMRAFRIYWRSSSYNLVRTTLVVVISILLGTVYWQLEYQQNEVWSRLALLYTLTFYVGLTLLLSGVSLLMPLRPSYYKERAAGTYGSWVYGAAYFIAELPYVFVNSILSLIIVWTLSHLSYPPDDFGANVLMYWSLFLPFWSFLYMCTILGHAIAAISPTMEVANAIAPGMGSWFSSFAGFYLPYTFLPTGYRWVYWLNPFRYTYEAMVLNQFKGYPISCEGSNFVNASGQPLCIYKTGDDVISAMGMLEWGYGLDIGVIWAYLLAFAAVTLIGLKWLRFGSK